MALPELEALEQDDLPAVGRPSMPASDHPVLDPLSREDLNIPVAGPAAQVPPVEVQQQVGGNAQPQVIGDANQVPPVENNNQQQENPAGNNNANENANANNAPNHNPPANEQQNAPARRDARPLTRNEVLKRRLVDNYKERKDELGMDRMDKTVAHNDELKKNAKIDSFSDKAFIGSLAGTLPPMLFGLGSTGMDFLGDPTNKDSFAGKYHDLVADNNTQDIMNGVSALGNLSGMVNGVSGYFANRRRAKKDKNANHRKVAELRKKANASYGIQSTAGLIGNVNNMGAFGKRPVDTGVENIGSGTSILSGITGLVGGVGGFMGKYYDFKSNRLKKKLHKEAAGKTGAISRRAGNNADNIIAHANQAIERVGDIGTQEKGLTIRELRKARHTAKAQKYAMDMASRLHERKSKGKTKGWAGLISSGFGLAGSAFTAASKFSGSLGALGMIGGALSAVGGVGTFLGHVVGDKMIAGKKRGNKMKADKKQIVDEYLQKKAEKVKAEAASIQFTDEERDALGEGGDVLSKEEAQRIAVMRLGINDRSLWEKIRGKQKETDAPLTPDAYDEVFKLLVRKRANNIMQSSDKDRNEMLDALGLDHDAGIEDVEAAINPDDAL